MRIAGVVTVMLGLTGFACTKESGSSAVAPMQGESGADSGITSDGGMETGRPPITVPDTWMRPADCHGVGNLCSMGCNGSVCQLVGDVCIPPWGPGGFPGWSPETPYCMAFTCMTYEEASCFCTGAAAAQFPSCKSGPAAVAGLCAGEQSGCVNGACCKGLNCVNVSPNVAICYQTCTTNADCDTGCCTDLKDTGDLECAPMSACQNACVKRGSACTEQTTCCNGTCVTGTTDPNWLGCRPTCSANVDCDTACCEPFAGGGGGFCVDPKYCGCGGIDKTCLEGSTCVTFDMGASFTCAKNCKMKSDCPSMCCTLPFPDKDYGSCYEGCAP
jgi:hypothetical protein